MTALAVIVALAAMFGVVLFGAMAPYRRATVPAVEPPADPLEDRRQALLVSMKDLQTSRDSGAIDADEYLRLRDDTETRMARVLRAIDERRQREEAGPEGAAAPPRRSPARYLAIAMVAVIALAIGLVPSLLRSLNDTSPANQGASLADFRARVQAHPHDVAARLDYAHRLLDFGETGGAFRQFTAVLALQPDNVDALANYGLLLHFAGQPDQALAAEDRALRIDPTYGEALFYKGTILLKGLDQPQEAIVWLQRYLDGNPTGSYGQSARVEIRQARAELAKTPAPTSSSSALPSASPPVVPTPQLTVPTG